MKLGLVVDLDTCVGCHACAVACKEWNGESAMAGGSGAATVATPAVAVAGLYLGLHQELLQAVAALATSAILFLTEPEASKFGTMAPSGSIGVGPNSASFEAKWVW